MQLFQKADEKDVVYRQLVKILLIRRSSGYVTAKHLWCSALQMWFHGLGIGTITEMLP